MAGHGHRQRDHGQPDCGGEGEAHDRGDAERLLGRDRFSGRCRAAHCSATWRGLGGGAASYEPNERDIVGDLVPFVDKHFRTLPNRDNRALAGLSMGAGIATNVAVKRLDVFASVGILSSGGFRPTATSPGGVEVIEKIAPDFFSNAAATNKKIRLLFFSVGTEDPRVPSLNDLQQQLRSRNIDFVFKSYPGEHEWKVWRHSLADMAPLLFK